VPLVAFWIVDAVGSRAAFGIAWEIVIVDLGRFLAPRLTRVFELTEEFLFLGVHADAWITTLAESLALVADMLELPIALGMVLTRVQHLAVAA
jgi:hypothetical protein